MTAFGADLHRFDSVLGGHLFVADGSRIYDIDEDLARELDDALPHRDAERIWADLGLHGRATGRWRGECAAPLPALKSISLNVAQACNMGCGYCYADAGRFGGAARLMPTEVARQAVDRLIAEAAPGAGLLVGFMGGEPLLNRRLLHEIVPYAAAQGAAGSHQIRFSITTNATLLTDDDCRLFAAHPFAVQVSIDGAADLNDRRRPMHDGSGSYQRIRAGLDRLQRQRPAQLTARMSVTRPFGDLLAALDHLIGLDCFDDVGLAPVLVAPSGALQAADFAELLRQMIACGLTALAHMRAGRRFPFSNFLTAMDQLHRGSHRPHACGAAAAYLSANAEGELYACHRLIDDPAFAMGHAATGLDTAARMRHLAARHVDAIAPCSTCWARYLCGGGCAHEVARRGRPGCDYIRGWLDFCLGAYAELSALGRWPVP